MSDDPDYFEEMRAAVAEIRREGYKAALLYAVVDGALVALVANLAVALVGIEALAGPVGLPAAVAGLESISAGTVLALLAGVVAAVAEVAYRVRRPLVERFESVNPEVHEALRTARDAVEDGNETPMAYTLYADVIDRLRGTSSVGLVNVPRLGLALLVALAASVATIHVSATGLGVIDAGPGPTAPSDGVEDPEDGGVATTPTPGELRSGDEVLGEPETVTPGTENLSASISYDEGGGDGDERGRSYETGGLSDPAVEAQRAGYAPRTDLEDAELIKEYNLRIREEET